MYVGLPSLEDRVSIIEVLGEKIEMSAEFKKVFAERMQGKSGADIHLVLKRARQGAFLDSMQESEGIFDVGGDSDTVVPESFVAQALDEFMEGLDKVRAALECP